MSFWRREPETTVSPDHVVKRATIEVEWVGAAGESEYVDVLRQQLMDFDVSGGTKATVVRHTHYGKTRILGPLEIRGRQVEIERELGRVPATRREFGR